MPCRAFLAELIADLGLARSDDDHAAAHFASDHVAMQMEDLYRNLK